MKLVLASASTTRRQMLAGAGLTFDVMPATVDEATLRHHLIQDGAALSDIAAMLAELKGKAISAAHPDALVIGADQILVLGHEIFEKPADMMGARATLQRLRGKTHELVSAVSLVRNGDCVWRASDAAQLTMRDFSNDFLEDYLAQVGDTVLTSVGAYQLEGRGAQLFSKVEGDFFTILGLPLLPLLDILREAEVIPS